MRWADAESKVVITDLVLQIMIEFGKRDMTNKLSILGCKFSVLLAGSWYVARL